MALPVPVILFLKKYWLHIIIVVLIIMSYVFTFNLGASSNNKEWTKRYNKETAALNKRIEELELSSREAVKAHETEMSAARGVIGNILTEYAKAQSKDIAFTSSGSILRCPSTEQPIQVYLGQDFQKSWNKINRTIGE